jgi:hypothetical protein
LQLPDWQMSFAQQMSPGLPQGWQILVPEQIVQGARQSPAAQQLWFSPPQLEQVPGTPPTQASAAVEQVRPEQQGWPAPPQVWQVALTSQTSLVVEQVLDAQQGWLVPPQATQTLPRQASLASQVEPGQQGWFDPPQVGASQVPLVQVSPLVQGEPLAQQA